MKHKNISVIKNVTTLKELSEYDEIIRHTCKNVISPRDYDNIVQELYLKADKYLKRGVIINAGYIFLMMKSININILNKEKHHEDVEHFNVLDDDGDPEHEYLHIDSKMDILDEFLETFLTQEEIALYKFYKMNTLNITAIFYGQKTSHIKYRIKKIMNKIKDQTNGIGLTLNLFKQK